MALHHLENSEQEFNQALVRGIIEAIDPNPDRPGLADTPRRVVESWKELFAGYAMKPEDILKEFDGEGYDEMVLVKDITFTAFCEHHMLPFYGVAHVAYIPTYTGSSTGPKGGKVFGLSKLARLVDCFAKRLTMQERVTKEVAEALRCRTQGAACVIEASHMCMGCRGANKPGAKTVTSYLVGAFFDKPQARAELFALINGR